MLTKRALVSLLGALLAAFAVAMPVAAEPGKGNGPKQNTQQQNQPTKPNEGKGNGGQNNTSTPDQDGKGMDRGVVNNDKTGPGADWNNGCGNDADREDDNNGWCGNKHDRTGAAADAEGSTLKGYLGEVADNTAVLGTQFSRTSLVDAAKALGIITTAEDGTAVMGTAFMAPNAAGAADLGRLATTGSGLAALAGVGVLIALAGVMLRLSGQPQ